MATAMLVFLSVAFFFFGTVDSMITDKEEEINSSKNEKATSRHRTDSLTILMLLGLLLLTVLTVWLFKHRRFRFVHETGLSMFYGLIVGAIIRFTSTDKQSAFPRVIIDGNKTVFADDPPDTIYMNVTTRNGSSDHTIILYDYSTSSNNEPLFEKTATFDPEIFFNVMLPVIIFEAGYSMKRRHFFRNLGAVLMYALIGTTVSCLVVGGILYGLTSLMNDFAFSLNDSFFFGAVISATDPVTVLAIFHDLHVDVDLYALVFGESVLNDAVAIVLSDSVMTYGKAKTDSFSTQVFFESLGKFLGVFTGAFAIGGLFGIATAFLTKFTKVREFPLLETALFFLMSYSSFQAAEAANLTGIVAVLFCGITQAHYTFNNLSLESQARTKQLFELANFLAENFVFLYIGVSVFTLQPLKWDAGFILSAFLAVIVGRLMNVYPLSFILNLGRSNKIRPNFQHMMMFSGLRGAVAFALAIRNIDTVSHQHMASATITIVMATVILCGGFTTPMLQWLQIRVGVESDARANQMTTVRNALSAQRLYNSMEPSLPSASSSIVISLQIDELSLQASPLLNLQLEQNLNPNTEPPPVPERRSEKAWLVAKWYNFDLRIMKPLLTNSRPTLMDTFPRCCLPVAKIFTTEEQLSQGIGDSRAGSDTDMIIDENQMSIGGFFDGAPSESIPGLAEDTVQKESMQLQEESSRGDLGLGQSAEPVPWRVGIYGPLGDKV